MKIWVALLSHYLELFIVHLFFVLIWAFNVWIKKLKYLIRDWELSHIIWNLYLNTPSDLDSAEITNFHTNADVQLREQFKWKGK